MLMIFYLYYKQRWMTLSLMLVDRHMWRADRNHHGGGIVSCLCSYIAGHRKSYLEFSSVKSTFVEVILDRKKWLISGSYKPPTL